MMNVALGRLQLAAGVLMGLLLFTAFVQAATVISQPTFEALNARPIIGVLSQEVGEHWQLEKGGQFESYIAASYVKFIEGGGARVVPIWINRTKEYYEDIMAKINGVLFPGGDVSFERTDGYAAAGRHIYDIAASMNDRGHFMPLWGTCLGFELLAYLTSTNGDPRVDCSAERQAVPLEFTKKFRHSRLFGKTPDDIVEILYSDPVTVNFHHFCLTQTSMEANSLHDHWKVLSLNSDINGLEFVSAIEHRCYPFFGVQFHPEKNVYEWITGRNIPHSANAIRVSQYFAEFFVDQCRRSDHRFAGGEDAENSVLIYNYPAKFTALDKSIFTQTYIFYQQ